ncbi:hypothetical protein C8R45DRAFT_948252 [Mycena sanguinolenta]|nr:hypothetical protein C8R45DRAFT_948252 [Mycena sanguinolenta]
MLYTYGRNRTLSPQKQRKEGIKNIGRPPRSHRLAPPLSLVFRLACEEMAERRHVERLFALYAEGKLEWREETKKAGNEEWRVERGRKGNARPPTSRAAWQFTERTPATFRRAERNVTLALSRKEQHRHRLRTQAMSINDGYGKSIRSSRPSHSHSQLRTVLLLIEQRMSGTNHYPPNESLLLPLLGANNYPSSISADPPKRDAINVLTELSFFTTTITTGEPPDASHSRCTQRQSMPRRLRWADRLIMVSTPALIWAFLDHLWRRVEARAGALEPFRCARPRHVESNLCAPQAHSASPLASHCRVPAARRRIAPHQTLSVEVVA